MYAVIQTGGKQYRVSEGEIIRIESIEKGLKETVIFDYVLLVENNGDLKVGNPIVEGVTVVAEVICHDRRKKVFIFKKKRTTTYQRTQGHRQNYTEVRITKINA